jgi:hypothetical protein
VYLIQRSTKKERNKEREKKRGSERERKGDKDREREGAVLTRQRSGQRLGIWNTNPGFESRLEFKVL